MLLLFYHTLQEDRFRVIVLQELLHLRWEVGGGRASDPVHTQSASELDVVGVGGDGMRVPRFVEQICKREANQPG